MDKKLERKIIWTLAILLIIVGLMCCAKPKVNGDYDPKENVTITDSIGNMGAIGKALGCMFGSNDPICDKKSKDIDEEWNKLEEQE